MSNNNFQKALEIDRPPNIQKLFPNSRALIVSGKIINQAMLQKTKAISIAANGRNELIIAGSLLAAQKANACIIIEIAKSESAYCAINLRNLANKVDKIANELNITIPIAIHADHYAIKNEKDLKNAETEIPELFKSGITSIAIDASHLPDSQNLLTSIELYKCVPEWAGYETEVGEIKGKLGLSTKKEALFLIQGLNAHNIFPDWIALNNGSLHGIQKESAGIQVELTRDIHDALAPYHVSGAQHGTSGNSSERLREIRDKTRTTKANVATALQFISWGVEVDEYGNAIMDESGEFKKNKNKGVTEELWQEMCDYAREHSLTGGDFKKLNLPFDKKILTQNPEIKERIINDVRDFVYDLIVNIFNASDTAIIAIEKIMKTNSYNLRSGAKQIENPEDWTPAKILEKAKILDLDKNEDHKENFDD